MEFWKLNVMFLEQMLEIFRNVGYYLCEIGGLFCEKEEMIKRNSFMWLYLWGDFVFFIIFYGIRFIFYQDMYIIRR